MISYRTGGRYFFTNLFILKGSVFPQALVISVPSATFTCIFVALLNLEGAPLGDHFRHPESVMNNNAIWGGFTFLVGFLVVFRTSQAYARFWEGATSMHQMGAEWFDACSSLMAFCKHSSEPMYKVLEFQNLLIRLFSMLHAAALGEIQGAGEGKGFDISQVQAFGMELIDAASINDESMRAIRDNASRVELIFQWIQQYVVENIATGVLSIPPPILSRSFQEIANGMVHFHDCMKLSNIPFPFPYAQTADALLVMHWFLVPFVVSQWVQNPWWAFIFSFMQIFTFWTLNLIAVELENPFGTDTNDIDSMGMQLEMNEHLRMLLKEETRATPHLKAGTTMSIGLSMKEEAKEAKEMMNRTTQRAMRETVANGSGQNFKALWSDMGEKRISTSSHRGRNTLMRSASRQTLQQRNSIISSGSQEVAANYYVTDSMSMTANSTMGSTSSGFYRYGSGNSPCESDTSDVQNPGCEDSRFSFRPGSSSQTMIASTSETSAPADTHHGRTPTTSSDVIGNESAHSIDPGVQSFNNVTGNWETLPPSQQRLKSSDPSEEVRLRLDSNGASSPIPCEDENFNAEVRLEYPASHPPGQRHLASNGQRPEPSGHAGKDPPHVRPSDATDNGNGELIMF